MSCHRIVGILFLGLLGFLVAYLAFGARTGTAGSRTCSLGGSFVRASSSC